MSDLPVPSEIPDEEEEALQRFLGTTSFGKQTKGAQADYRFEQSKRQQPVISQPDKKANDPEDSDSDDDSDDDDDEDEYPVSHEMVFKTHDRAVTSITLDASGGRMVTGSNDCTLKFHDFASLTPSTIRAFKSVDPSSVKGSASSETHPVNHVSFNPISPSTILAITAHPQPRILDRNGETLAEFVKGDMYLRDMHHTKGHISEVTCGVWHPEDRNICATGGTDSTVRIWDVNNPRQQRNVIVHKSRAAGSAGRTRITALSWAANPQFNLLVAAALDGSLVMWDGNGPYTRPAAEIRDAHTKDTWTSSLQVSSTGQLVLTRGGDDTIKLWDTRKFKQPLRTVDFPSMSSQYPTSNICWSPLGTEVLTGSANGDLHILNPATLKSELVTPVTPGSALISVYWHKELNQIITGSANGETHVLYNPNISQGGAKTVML
ncbi:WD40 repeat-like protein, partial [Aureobasidium melanogenum]